MVSYQLAIHFPVKEEDAGSNPAATANFKALLVQWQNVSFVNLSSGSDSSAVLQFMTYIYSESAFIVMATEMGLYLWTPGADHVFRPIMDNELWFYALLV